MARRSESIQRLIDDADQSISLLASLDGLADAPPSSHASAQGRTTRVPPRSAGFGISSAPASASSDSFDFASSTSSVPLLSASLFGGGGGGDSTRPYNELPSSSDTGAGAGVVDRSVRAGLLHVCGMFPDHSVEFVDIDPRFASIGELKRALCAKRAPQRDLGFDAADARVMFDNQLVEDDWLVVDCGMGFDGAIRIVRASSSTASGFLATTSGRGFGARAAADPKLAVSSIASAYSSQSALQLTTDAGNNSSAALAQQTLAVRAESLSRHVRPEEGDFAAIASDFYEHLAGVADTDLYCEKLLTGYIDVLQTRLEHLEDAAAATRSSANSAAAATRVHDDIRELRDERNTWRLLYELRQICHTRDDSAEDVSDEDAAMTAGDSMDDLHFDMVEDDAVRLLESRNDGYRIQRAVRTWLESMALEQTVALRGARSTGARTLQLLQKGVAPSSGTGVVHLDPDAVLRDGDADIAADDAEDDADVLKSVWYHVRAGQLSDAIDLCVRVGQPWRAASLSGGTPLGASVGGSDAATATLERWGNPLRALWKTTCWQFAERGTSGTGVSLTKSSSVLARQYEEIVYAALSGHVAVITRSPLCETWEDHVWAHVSAMLEQQHDELLHELLRVKRQSSQLVVGHTAHYLRHYSTLLDRTKYLKRYAGDLDALFHELQSSGVARVRAQANEPHRHIQAKLVTAKVEFIVAHILDALLFSADDDTYNWDLALRERVLADAQSPLFLRFAAHFVLFSTFTGERFDEQAGHMIVKLYIRHLVKHRQLQLVPVYASRLPFAGAVEVYVQVLAVVDDPLERELVVKRILAYASMDVLSTVLHIAVSRMGDEYRVAAAAAATADSSGRDSSNVAIAVLDAKRMRTIEYLCLFPEHRGEALHRANVLAREFVAERKFSALATLFNDHVPEDSLAVVELHRSVQTRDARGLDRSIRETLCWRAYIAASSAYDAWRACVSADAGASAPTRYSDEKDFVTELVYHAARAASCLREALHFEHGWLRVCLESADDEASVRQQCLPLLVFHLQYVHLESARVLLRLRWYPEAARVALARPLLEQALEVADVVADAHYGVADALSPSECRDLLHGFRESAIALVHTESVSVTKEPQN